MLVVYAENLFVSFSRCSFSGAWSVKYKNYKQFEFVSVLGLDKREFTTCVIIVLAS